jgi:hypothetical protein
VPGIRGEARDSRDGHDTTTREARPCRLGANLANILSAQSISIETALLGLVAVVLTCLSIAGSHAPPARADGDELQYEEFYTPPDPLPPAQPGDVIRTEPSRMFNQGIHYSSGWDIVFNYEELFVATMVARGFAIAMTDYEGLGTAPMHTYVNRLAEGQAVLDAARAAMRLPGTPLDPHGPVAFWRYSQGGGAVTSAAELASS